MCPNQLKNSLKQLNIFPWDHLGPLWRIASNMKPFVLDFWSGVTLGPHLRSEQQQQHKDSPHIWSTQPSKSTSCNHVLSIMLSLNLLLVTLCQASFGECVCPLFSCENAWFWANQSSNESAGWSPPGIVDFIKSVTSVSLDTLLPYLSNSLISASLVSSTSSLTSSSVSSKLLISSRKSESRSGRTYFNNWVTTRSLFAFRITPQTRVKVLDLHRPCTSAWAKRHQPRGPCVRTRSARPSPLPLLTLHD